MEFSQQTIYIEVFGKVNIYFGIGVQILSAFLLGGLVGYDREIKMKTAGLKTNIMICVGSTLYTTISLLSLSDSPAMIDPNRVSAQIVSGIGFLGAGAIIQSRGSVIGLTTAATIWVVAAIGYTIGVGYPLIAAIFTLTAIVILKLINPFVRVIENRSEHQEFNIQVLSSGDCKRFVSRIVMNADNIELDEIYEEESTVKKGKYIINIFLKGHPRAVERIVQEITGLVKVEKCSHRIVSSIESDEIEELVTKAE
ncbi:MAG: hypothetical protein CME65_14800 [Halobacteriovoraceae bacterium]|nr:hypothetical protein [Halobacteriovoraceae bacterium]|tara:strand:+ start:1937 stop:2698 length:762 start_codon:yes stop_codon:yes gene_type:complete